MLERINETTEYLKAKGMLNPDAGIILGTGLGGLTSKIENRIEIDYKNIPEDLPREYFLYNTDVR